MADTSGVGYGPSSAAHIRGNLQMDTPTYPGTKSSRSTDAGDPHTLYTHFPAVPGEDPMPHQGTAWYEAAVGRLAGRLLRVANGLVPTDVEKIVDIDLTQIPQLPITHAQHERRSAVTLVRGSAVHC